MKPYKTLIILLVLMVLLYGPSLFRDTRFILPGGFTIELPSVSELPDPIPGKLSALMPGNFSPGRHTVPPVDTTEAPGPLPAYLDTLLTNPDSLAPGVTGPLLTGLDSILTLSNEQVRVIYYGDSQMEGDRITDYLRLKLRERAGGSGPGLLSPTMLVPYTRTAWVRASQNWERYSYLSDNEGDIDHDLPGPMLSFSRFSTGDDAGTTAWIKVVPSATSDIYTSKYENLRIFYGRLKDSLELEIMADGRLAESTVLAPVEKPAEVSIPLGNPSELEIRFRGKSSPDLYGFSIESDSGIMVDNIALRGSAGLEFSRTDSEGMSSMFRMLDPDLLILHFGLNVVLNIRDSYAYYENSIYSQLQWLKKACPEAEILVVSVTDMAYADTSGIVSYNNIPLIVEAQRRAAGRAGVLFWDSWQAMGGSGSIIKWKERVPSLASNDYTHISYEGGHQLAKLMMDDIFPGDTSSAEPPDSLAVLVDTITPVTVAGELTSEKDQGILNLLRYTDDEPLMFTSLAFWIFLLVLLVGYLLISGSPLARNTYLFLFSLLFYYKSGGLFFILLLLSTLVDYSAGWFIYLSRRKGARLFWLIISLVMNLGMLAWFKYSAFFTGLFNDIAGTSIPQVDWLAKGANRWFGTSFDTSSVILPVGISFFTFQTISYSFDIYRRLTKPVHNILDFGFYVSFFPQLVAGPIVRASEFIPQLYRKFSLTRREWSHALFLVISGLIKKVIVSDFIAINFVDRVFDTPAFYSGLENLLAIYGYGLQIYCDFSGYTDIAIGVALMLGFRLPVNFNSPYKADSISDFWRRWHISLSRWLKDSLYISLGGNGKGGLRT